MSVRALAAISVLAAFAVHAQAQEAEKKPSLAERYRKDADALLEAARTKSKVYDRLRHLCDAIGPRLTGSAGHHKAAHWCMTTMKEDGLDNARQEAVMAPVWIRGEESARIVEPRLVPLHMLGLGNSVGTPEGGVRAEVVVVNNLEELKDLGEGAKGKIVLFNHPMPKFNPETGATGYGPTVMYRVIGPSRAAAAGAVAVLVRSVTAESLQTPHTGMLRYAADLPQIPAAAVSIENAEMISRMTAAGTKVVVELKMGARFLADSPSPNVVAELLGSEKPEEVVVIGGHL
ncbi:MAG: zinc-binding metallopeptidase family protein, partial [Planctomycetota bacterium]